jgi:phosphatidylinositol-3-phosphatase
MSMSASMRTRGCAAARAVFSIAFITLLLVSVSAAQIPSSQHVVLVIEENHDYAQVLASMPWLVSQGNANGYATNYVAESGGSLKDYLWLASGSCHSSQTTCTLPPGTNSYSCTGNGCTSPITDDNIFREMNSRGISWKVYAQSYSAASGVAAPAGIVQTPDGANGTNYYRRHNGVTWYDDILSHLDSHGGYANLVDLSQFSIDLANNALPQFVIIVPDGAHDAHDGCDDSVTPIVCLQNADNFLKTNLGPMLSKSYFQPGGDGLLFVTFDECGDGVNTNCSTDNIYTAVIGPKVLPGTASGVFHQHSSTLRTMLEALGITTFMGGAASANDLSEFFNSPGSVLLADDFSSASIDTTKWLPKLFTGSQNTSVAVNDANGQLQIGPLPTNASSSSYNGITSLNRYDFTGADAYVQLVQPAAAASNAFTMFAVGNDTNNFYRFYVSGGSLVCEQKIGGTKSQVGSTAYNATTQQFLRIRHDASAGNVVWETAPNNSGGSWTQQCSTAWNTTAVPVNSVLFEMKAGTSVPESTAPGTILFDNFRAEKPVLLTDNFASAPLDTTKWSNTIFTGSQNTTVAVADTNGQLQIGPLPTNASSSSYNGITSAKRYDFTGAYAYVQLVQAAASNSNAFTMFAVGNDSSNFYRFYVSGGSLVCEKKIAGTKSQIGSAVYDAVNQQFLRIRHDASSGNVVYETAPNNSGSPGSWTQQCSEAWNTTAVPVTSVLFEMKAGTSVAEPNAPGTVIFDNFNAAKQ